MPLETKANAVQSAANVQQTIDLPLQGPRPAMIRTAGGDKLTAEQQARILEGLESGQGLASILRDNPDLPGARAINRERRTNEAFGNAFADAMADGTAANIEEALDYAHSVRGNKQLSIAASKYADAIMKSAPLRAPKEYGALLKLAGADGNRLTVALVAYGAPQVEQAQEPVRLASAASDNDQASGAEVPREKQE